MQRASMFLSTGDPLSASTIAIQDIDIPEPRPTDVVIKVVNLSVNVSIKGKDLL